MKRIKLFALVLVLLMLPFPLACAPDLPQSASVPSPAPSDALQASEPPRASQTPAAVPPSTGSIYLYGESHGVEAILHKEADLWYEYYHKQNMRHLFVEYSYFTAEFLNLWMKESDDALLDAVYAEWAGTQAQVPAVKEFYKRIKAECPETVFHGTDVGHQYDTTGARYLRLLEESGQRDSEQYRLAAEAIGQGKRYYAQGNDVYRENTMAENFIRAFDALEGESVMGIYGAAHTGLGAMDYDTHSVPCMANRLKERYGEAVFSEDLTKNTEPIRVDTIRVGEKDYEASYFGTQDLTRFFKDYASRAFWRLENAYDDFKLCPVTNNILPYNNYPMPIEEGQVFVIDYTMADGSLKREYLRSDGNWWKAENSAIEFVTEEFTLK